MAKLKSLRRPFKLLLTTELRNLKALLETGEIATIVGQPHGQRSLIGSSVSKGMDAGRTAIDEAAKGLTPPKITTHRTKVSEVHV